MRNPWVPRLALFLLGCLLAFLLLEGLTRLAFSVAKESDKFWQPDPLLGWTNIPNKRGFYRSTEFGEIPVAINSKGLRDVEHDYTKAAGTFRILVLGDSFAQALQVRLEESFPKLLEAMLNEERLSVEKYEVINAGVTGYGTDQELLFFRREGFKYGPDLVILTFCTINDVMDNSPKLEIKDLADRKQFFVLNDGKLELREVVFSVPSSSTANDGLQAAIRSVLNRSRLYQVVRRLLREGTQGMIRLESKLGEEQDTEQKPYARTSVPTHYGVYAPQYTPEWAEAWEVTRAVILQLRDEVQAHGARFMVVIATTGEELYEEWRHLMPEGSDLDKPNRILGEFLSQNDIPYLSLLPYFRQDYQETGRYLHFRVDGHWTVEGHRLAARALYDSLAQQEELLFLANRGKAMRDAR